MAQLWVPPGLEHEAAMTRVLEDVRRNQHAIAQALHDLDPRLSLKYCPARANPDEVPGGVVPGCYFVRFDPDNAAPVFIPIMGPDGERVEPTWQVIEDLKRLDLRNKPKAGRAFLELRRKEAARAEVVKQKQREERRAEIVERVNQKINTSVRIPRSV